MSTAPDAAVPTRLLLVKSGGEAAVPVWRRHIREIAPFVDVRGWDDPSVAPERVDYALAWQPEPGRLASFPNLRLILSAAAGTDHITSDPAWPRATPLVRAIPPETAQRMGEYVCMAALALLRDLPRMTRQQAERRWQTFDAGRSATDTCVGILGLGAMGARAAAMVRGLGFRTIGWSRSPKAVDGVECHAGRDALPAFLGRCDILVCLLPATPETDGLLDARCFASLPAGAGLIHVGRGSHLRFDDLVGALDSGHLAGAFVDVFAEEPPPADHPAWTHPKIVVTPHVGAIASIRMRAHFLARQIVAFERGEAPEGRYDPALGY